MSKILFVGHVTDAHSSAVHLAELLAGSCAAPGSHPSKTKEQRQRNLFPFKPIAALFGYALHFIFRLCNDIVTAAVIYSAI